MSEFSLSSTVVSHEGDRLYTFEYAASVTQTSTIVIERFVQLGLIEPKGSMLHSREIARIAQIQRLRRDLGLNLVGAAMVMDMAQEIAQLRAQLKALQPS
ncbi:chaperone modulator CbpM [Nostoc sp. C110]|uniref:chaperone modulator CbpM n=1 Tax=Nostoc sp. C110 TaxID=3349876 RepID=UPI00370D82F8